MGSPFEGGRGMFVFIFLNKTLIIKYLKKIFYIELKF